MVFCYYSASENGFFFPCDLDECRESELGLPDDLIEVSDTEHAALMDGQDAGKMIAPDADGRPILIDRPAPTSEQLIEIANTEKEQRLNAANTTIAPLQDAVDLGMATDKEKESLEDWKKYRVLLNRVDTSTAPDIEWPVEPSSQAGK